GFIPRSESFRLLYDRQQNLWMSSSSGLYKLSPENNAIQWLYLPENKSTQVAHLVPDPRFPGERFFITTLNGWYTFSYSSQSITPFPLPLNGRQLMCEINDWEIDTQGIWFTSMQGLGYYNFNTKQLYDYSDIIIKASGQPVAGRMAKDAKGRLWIAMRRSGMLVFDPASKTAIPVFHEPGAKQSFFGQDIRDVQAGPNGYIYITAIRLCRIHPETFAMTETFPPDNREDVDVRQISPEKICINPAGRMLVTSRRKIYEYVNGRLEPRFPQQGSSDFELYKLYTADNDRYYALTSKGLFVTDAALRRWKPIPLPADENGNFPGEITIRQPGSVLVPETGRLGVVNEAALPQPQNAPGILFSRIKLGKNEYFLYGEPGNRLRTSFKNSVEIELAACNFLSENETRIMYRLQGWDEEWKTVATSPIVRYEQLPPGSYRFTAKTMNSEGVESAETVLRFTIVPPFYKTWWFITLCVAVVATVSYLFYRYRLRKALELEKMRTRIATDLHDDLGATLSSISMYSETLKNQVKEKLPQLEPVLNRIGENSREMVAGISDIVWAINPGNDDGERLLQRMENYAADTCAAKQVQLHFTASEKIKQLQFELENRKNIYLVFKEAVNNAVKYAHAQHIWVNLALHGKELVMEVKDDGRGFDMQTAAKGNGLKNMQLRAAEIKGRLILESAPGAGTRIRLECTL
ncbi:MAG: ATP-binding protein, partial [Dinghuibacter sp.]|nr:ATP-binding protein [Dinghuibacter sp.]